MAYVKLYKAESDCPIGYQSINQLRDNFDAVRDAMAAAHATGVLSGLGKSNGKEYYSQHPPWELDPGKALGVHDDQRIQRAVAYIDWYTPPYSGAAQQPFITWASRAITEVHKFSTGVCFIPVREWTTFWATVTTVYDATDAVLFHSCRPYYAPSGQPNTSGLFIHSHKVSGGAYVAADGNPFMIDLYGK